MTSTRLAAIAVLILLGLTARAEPAAPPETAGATTKSVQESTTPKSALERLLAGNERYLSAKPLKRDSRADIKATAPGQYPFAAVLSCIDSRVPPEMIFDQGLGDIFSARVAGNVVDDVVLGSLEYATQAAGARLILVLGHTHCGAVKAACQGVKLEHVDEVLNRIAPAIPKGSKDESSQDFFDSVAESNVRQSAKQLLERSATIRALVRSGRVAVQGALYDVETGKVRLIP